MRSAGSALYADVADAELVAVQIYETKILLNKVFHHASRNFTFQNVSARAERLSFPIKSLIANLGVFNWYVIAVKHSYPGDRTIDHPESGDMPVDKFHVDVL